MQDVVISFLLAAGHFIAGVLEAFYAGEWNDDITVFVEDRDTIRNSMIASAVSLSTLINDTYLSLFLLPSFPSPAPLQHLPLPLSGVLFHRHSSLCPPGCVHGHLPHEGLEQQGCQGNGQGCCNRIIDMFCSNSNNVF